MSGLYEIHRNRDDDRSIEDKALGLIYAMDDAAALRLLFKLREMAAKGSNRAAMFCGGAVTT